MKRQYIRLLTRFREQGYKFYNYDNYKNESSIVLRHDIDFSLDSALKVAKWNKEEGVSGTFFFMMTGFSYNLLEKNSKEIVQEIVNYNQNISIHFDPTAYINADLVQGFLSEKIVFEKIFDTKIKIFSVHRPGPFLNSPNQSIQDCKSTYADEFTKKMKYFSDSGGEGFKYGHPCDSEEFAKHKNIQLLLHPIWWTEKGNTPTEKLNSWIENRTRYIGYQTSKNCKTYSAKKL